MGPAASLAQISNLEKCILRSLPEDYKEFLKRFNGGEGPLGNVDLRILGSEEVPIFNADYGITRRLGREIVAFATDGGDQCIVFDFQRPPNLRVVSFPLGALAFDEEKYLSASFKSLLLDVAAGSIKCCDI